jgi:hypothetical protein
LADEDEESAARDSLMPMFSHSNDSDDDLEGGAGGLSDTESYITDVRRRRLMALFARMVSTSLRRADEDEDEDEDEEVDVGNPPDVLRVLFGDSPGSSAGAQEDDSRDDGEEENETNDAEGDDDNNNDDDDDGEGEDEDIGLDESVRLLQDVMGRVGWQPSASGDILVDVEDVEMDMDESENDDVDNGDRQDRS